MKRWQLIARAFVLGIILWVLWANTALEQTFCLISDRRVPAGLDGFRIVHISDLHNTEFGTDGEKLIRMIRDAKPDMIAITGDLIDARRLNVEVALKFAEEAMKIAPCYYVTGNHESRIAAYSTVRQELQDLGVVVLEDARQELQWQGHTITIAGVNDPTFPTAGLRGSNAAVMSEKLQQLLDEDSYTVLLSHRPELFDTYVHSGADLVLTGHAHGGQIRLPFAGGILVPNQGWFPEYEEGVHEQNGTYMIISRGLGNSLFPLRINNRPEVILIELDHISN